MQKEQASRDLRNLVETMVSNAFKDVTEEADAYWGAPQAFGEFASDVWGQILGVRMAAIELNLKDPLYYRGKRYYRSVLTRDLWNTVKKHKGRNA